MNDAAIASRWLSTIPAADLAVGDVTEIELEGERIALYNLSGQFHATQNVCTHDFALLSEGFLEQNIIECPLHQACFDVVTGKHLSGVECDNLKVFLVKVEGGTIFIELPVR